MKKFVVAMVLAIVGLALTHPSQAASLPPAAQLGYWDETTATFTPLITPKVAPNPNTVITASGTVVAKITLHLESAIGTDADIGCTVSIGESDASFSNSASASGSIVRSSATLGTATITIPYEWTIVGPSEPVSIGVGCSIFSSTSRTITFFGVAGFTVPASPSTTTRNLTASM